MGAGAGNRAKTLIVSLVVVLANVCGNFLMGWGLKHGPPLTASPLSYLRVMFDPFVAAGVLLLIFWLLSRITLLSRADLSFVLPVTASGYVLSVMTGWLFLGEYVSPSRWTGTVLILLGTLLVGGTPPRSDR
jgi:uncharacterized membrane protein